MLDLRRSRMPKRWRSLGVSVIAAVSVIEPVILVQLKGGIVVVAQWTCEQDDCSHCRFTLLESCFCFFVNTDRFIQDIANIIWISDCVILSLDTLNRKCWCLLTAIDIKASCVTSKNFPFDSPILSQLKRKNLNIWTDCDYSRRSVFLRWLTVTFLFVNLVACLALITLICNQNEMLNGTTPTEQRVLLNTEINVWYHTIFESKILLGKKY